LLGVPKGALYIFRAILLNNLFKVLLLLLFLDFIVLDLERLEYLPPVVGRPGGGPGGGPAGAGAGAGAGGGPGGEPGAACPLFAAGEPGAAGLADAADTTFFGIIYIY
jgi:hypothetical protein